MNSLLGKKHLINQWWGGTSVVITAKRGGGYFAFYNADFVRIVHKNDDAITILCVFVGWGGVPNLHNRNSSVPPPQPGNKVYVPLYIQYTMY